MRILINEELYNEIEEVIDDLVCNFEEIIKLQQGINIEKVTRNIINQLQEQGLEIEESYDICFSIMQELFSKEGK